jgi:hypothetical protein
MSEESSKHRKSAADHLRASRNAKDAPDKARDLNIAASYKHLAHNAEWSEGEKERSRRRSKQPNDADRRNFNGEES